MGDFSEYPEAWIIDEPDRKVSPAQLKALGVLAWKLDADNWEKEGKLAKIREERHYKNHDFVKSTDIPNLEEKLATFKTEHIHVDEEIRFVIDGTGFFDVRNEKDEFVRIRVYKGDMIVLPAGSHHRFVPDKANLFFHAMRLFQDEPVWTPYNRGEPGTEEKEARQEYVKTYLEPLK